MLTTGGLHSLVNYIAEDFFMAKTLYEKFVHYYCFRFVVNFNTVKSIFITLPSG